MFGCWLNVKCSNITVSYTTLTLDNRHATKTPASDGALPPVVSRGQRGQQSRTDATTGRREAEQRGGRFQRTTRLLLFSLRELADSEQRPLEEACQTRTPTQTERCSEDVGG